MKVSKRKIDVLLEREGYNGFIPYNFINDLLNCYANARLGGTLIDGIEGNDTYHKTLRELMNLISGDIVKKVNSGGFVKYVLDQYGKSMDLRKVEKASEFLFDFVFDEEEEQMNYNIDLGEIPDNILTMFGIDSSLSYNTIKLPDDVKYILKFYQSFQDFPGEEESKPKIIRERMRTYNKVIKAQKHAYIMPTFRYSMITKQLRVKQPVVEKKRKNRVVIALDISSSVSNIEGYFELFKAVLLHYYAIMTDGKYEVDVVLYTSDVVNTLTVKNKEDLMDIIKADMVPLLSVKGWQSVYDAIEGRYDGEDIINITENEEDVMLGKKINNTWYNIVFRENETLNKLAKLSNGKYIKIWEF